MFTEEQLNRIITVHTCRDYGFCLSGSKQHIESLGLNFKECWKNGITVRDAVQLDDCLLNRLIDLVTKEG
jgi:DNA-binding transcriptional MerR regulator